MYRSTLFAAVDVGECIGKFEPNAGVIKQSNVHGNQLVRQAAKTQRVVGTCAGQSRQYWEADSCHAPDCAAIIACVADRAPAVHDCSNVLVHGSISVLCALGGANAVDGYALEPMLS